MATWNTKNKEVEQHKEPKAYWIVMINTDGFESVFLVYGTQTEMWDYMKKSFFHAVHYRYRYASEEDVEMAKKLGIKAYIC